MIAIIILLFLTLNVNAQDTLHITRVRISKKVQLSRKTNKIIRAWPHWVKVSEGYILREKKGLYYFNDQYWKEVLDQNKNLLAFTPVKWASWFIKRWDAFFEWCQYFRKAKSWRLPCKLFSASKNYQNENPAACLFSMIFAIKKAFVFNRHAWYYLPGQNKNFHFNRLHFR